MVTYKKAIRKYGVGYTKNNVFVKGDRVPEEVKERLEYAPEMEYDDKPERRRCLFCEAPQSHLRVYNDGSGPTMIDLCEYHYLNKNLGQIAQQLRESQVVAESLPVKKKRRKAKV